MTGFYPTVLLVMAALVALLTRSHLRREPKAARGTDPGPGDTVIDTGYMSGGPGGGHGHVTRVTRDPQKYARGFVPSKARKN